MGTDWTAVLEAGGFPLAAKSALHRFLHSRSMNHAPRPKPTISPTMHAVIVSGVIIR